LWKHCLSTYLRSNHLGVADCPATSVQLNLYERTSVRACE
jgi:hypothetical protein